jgi:hypothetical protein
VTTTPQLAWMLAERLPELEEAVADGEAEPGEPAAT